MEVNYDKDSLENLLLYTIGLYSGLVNKNYVLLEVNDSDKEKYDSLIIPKEFEIKPFKFDPEKTTVRGRNCVKKIPKIHERLYKYFLQFASEHCVFNDILQLQIYANELAKEFSDYIEEPVDTRNLFPAIMAQFMKEHPYISRLSTYKGVIYQGIDLQKNIENSKVKPPPK